MLKSPMTKTEDNKQGQNCGLTSNHSVYLVIRSAFPTNEAFWQVQVEVVELVRT